jgi:hypothetical protein
MKSYRDREGRRAETNADQVVRGSVDGGSVCGWGLALCIQGGDVNTHYCWMDIAY